MPTLNRIAPPARRFAILGGILLLALAVRLPLVLHTGDAAFLAVDGNDYQDIAKNLAAGRGYSISYYRWFEPVLPNVPNLHPDFYRPPFLPVLGAGLYLLPGPWILWARATMLLMGLAMVLAVYALGAQLLGSQVGGVAALLVAFDPFAAHYATTWSTETPFALCLLIGFACLAALARARGFTRACIGAGLGLGLACLARPTGIVITCGILAWLAVSSSRSGRVRQVLYAGLTVALLVAPWAIRNMRLTGTPNPATYFGPYNLWLGNNHRMHEMYVAGESAEFPQLLDSLYEADSKSHVKTLKLLGLTTTRAANDYWLRQVHEYVLKHPAEAADTILRRLLHFIRPWPNRATASPWEFWVAILWVVPVLALGCWSLIRWVSVRNALLLAPILLGLLACLPFIFHLRFRFPFFDSYAAILAAPTGILLAQRLGRIRHLATGAPRAFRGTPSESHPNYRIDLPASGCHGPGFETPRSTDASPGSARAAPARPAGHAHVRVQTIVGNESPEGSD